MSNPFNLSLHSGLNDFTTDSYLALPSNETIRIDLHCHDYNSDKPDELLGRILNLPETWLPSDDLIKTLRKHSSTAFTITNHNNARSCWNLQEKGYDILPAAEFSCTVPDFNTGIHVLAYGFTMEQEKVLNKLRPDLYRFKQYAFENDIPTVWAHPLYFYSPKGIPPMEFFEKTALLFDKFEVLNGQRDTWQNLLTLEWLKTFDEDKVVRLVKKFHVDTLGYVKDPFYKVFTGGSDSHMGIFAGLTGTYLHVPNLEHRKKTENMSALALEAIKNGSTVPFGGNNNSDKMATAFLDYVCQIAINHRDPGLLRILLHKGTTQDKIIAILVSNGFGELRRHKVTMNFMELFHKSFLGKAPHFSKKWFIPRDYKPIFENATQMANTYSNKPGEIVNNYNESIIAIHNQLNSVLATRLEDKVSKLLKKGKFEDFDFSKFMEKLEIPSELRAYLDNSSQGNNPKIQHPDLNKFLDGLSFPFLASTIILAAQFTSAKVLYNNRSLLNQFSEMTGKYRHPKRMLWLTDTFSDGNGVSMVLQSMLDEIQAKDLPIDILVASKSINPQKNLLVIDPIAEFSLPNYAHQPLRIPNYLTIHNLFLHGRYDRVMVSTEGPMGMAALYLKHAFSVKAHFYLHTDWITFAKKALKFDSTATSRLRRILRWYYQNFDHVFVLNKEQQKWLIGKQMNLSPESVKLTAHWTDAQFIKHMVSKSEMFNISHDAPVVLFAGRISEEKGVDELPAIMAKLIEEIPNAQLVVAGKGPYEDKLKEQYPQAIFLGWVDHANLPKIYSAADICILPSKFDTFSMVVLEAISCGLPVIAYNTKGPKEILEETNAGFLVSKKSEMQDKMIQYFKNPAMQAEMKHAAIKRSGDFSSHQILSDFLAVVEL